MKKSTIITDALGKLQKVTLDFNEATGEVTASHEAVEGKEAARISFDTSNNGKKAFQILFDENNALQAWEIVKKKKLAPFWFSYLDKGKKQFEKAISALEADYQIDLSDYQAIASIDPENPLLPTVFDNFKQKYLAKVNAVCAAFDEKLKAGKSRQSLIDRTLWLFSDIA